MHIRVRVCVCVCVCLYACIMYKKVCLYVGICISLCVYVHEYGYVCVGDSARTLCLGVVLDVLGRDGQRVDWPAHFEAPRLRHVRLRALIVGHGLGANRARCLANRDKPVLQLPPHRRLHLLAHRA
jgi:hypothetical protein